MSGIMTRLDTQVGRTVSHCRIEYPQKRQKLCRSRHDHRGDLQRRQHKNLQLYRQRCRWIVQSGSTMQSPVSESHLCRLHKVLATELIDEK